MKTLKRLSAVLTASALALALSATAFAAVEDTGFSDVAADAWYGEAVMYCRDNGLMNGTSQTTFTPDATMTRHSCAPSFTGWPAAPRSPERMPLQTRRQAPGMKTLSSGQGRTAS